MNFITIYQLIFNMIKQMYRFPFPFFLNYNYDLKKKKAMTMTFNYSFLTLVLVDESFSSLHSLFSWFCVDGALPIFFGNS